MSVASSPEPRSCARGALCIWYERDGKAAKLSRWNPYEICESCREADNKALPEKTQRSQADDRRLVELEELERLKSAGQKVLISNMVGEMQQFKRDLICELFIRQGPFWNEVSEMRARWGISPSRQLPQPGFFPTTYSPEHISAKEKGDALELAHWNADLKAISDRTVPQKYRLRTGDWPASTNWMKLISACVLYNPPRNDLLAFAASISTGARMHYPSPPDLWKDYALEDLPLA